MRWQTLFSPTILGRGRNCFEDGEVVGLHRDAEAWRALAVGTMIYRVETKIDQGSVTALACNCPHAKKGNRCKHMAALFCALAEMGDDALRDDDQALSARLDALTPAEADALLQLAIDANSTRCTAVLLNHKSDGDAPAFSPDEFTLDDLPPDALAAGEIDHQGDNDPMKLLFPEKIQAMRKVRA